MPSFVSLIFSKKRKDDHLNEVSESKRTLVVAESPSRALSLQDESNGNCKVMASFGNDLNGSEILVIIQFRQINNDDKEKTYNFECIFSEKGNELIISLY